MAHLSETDKASFRELSKRGWEQSEKEQSPRYIEPALQHCGATANGRRKPPSFSKAPNPSISAATTGSYEVFYD
ncbi:hypothetical protein SH580_09680 [Coraliomargarita algicola]|uniref:Uncharacterized protein n=1 Tax=Coraliomargarita algicola TaxID=3092156 RepID=A0ABZ0RP10_9BACT|nr:hypothetical protein [Coraliomargarita sp. J2-16]WPJ97979.1 hypothetical protein SH580_09680 [Coraliomargarita sp. J2-16]